MIINNVFFFFIIGLLHVLKSFYIDYGFINSYLFIIFYLLNVFGSIFFVSRHTVDHFYNIINLHEFLFIIYILNYIKVNYYNKDWYKYNCSWYCFKLMSLYFKFYWSVYTYMYIYYKLFNFLKKYNISWLNSSLFLYFIIIWPVYIYYCLPLFLKVLYYFFNITTILYLYINYIDIFGIWVLVYYSYFFKYNYYNLYFWILIFIKHYWWLSLICVAVNFKILISLHIFFLDFIINNYLNINNYFYYNLDINKNNFTLIKLNFVWTIYNDNISLYLNNYIFYNVHYYWLLENSYNSVLQNWLMGFSISDYIYRLWLLKNILNYVIYFVIIIYMILWFSIT